MTPLLGALYWLDDHPRISWAVLLLVAFALIVLVIVWAGEGR